MNLYITHTSEYIDLLMFDLDEKKICRNRSLDASDVVVCTYV